jgi:hypothetical protein
MPVFLPHYQIELKLLPSGQYAEVQINLMLPDRGEIKRLAFYLHKQFGINRLTGKDLAGYAFNRDPAIPAVFSPQAGLLEIFFEESQAEGEAVELEFEYAGWITAWPEWSANQITRDWVEMGLYLPWFPQLTAGGRLTFDLEVTCESGYEVLGYGKSQKVGDRWRFTQENPVSDIVVAAAKDISRYESTVNGIKVRFDYLNLSKETAEDLVGDIHWIMEKLSGWFGAAPVDELALIQSPREKGGGYSRHGLIVLGGLDDTLIASKREAILRYLGHETAHLWWNRAEVTTWEDWLNESFAEYSALLLVREKFGQAAFEARLEQKKTGSAGSPPIWGFRRGDDIENPQVDQTLYQKGPLLLHALSQRIREDRFLSLLRTVYQQEVKTSANFLELLDEQAGEETRFWMEKRLKEA